MEKGLNSHKSGGITICTVSVKIVEGPDKFRTGVPITLKCS